jgi:hypothetical protein
MSREDADALARMGLDWILDAVTAQYPVLKYPEDVRARGSTLAGAVLVKYDVLAWAGRWRAEFELGAFLAGLAWGSWRTLQAAQAVTAQEGAQPGASRSAASQS